MICFNDVSKIYSKPNGEKFYALKDFNFSFDKIGMYCILGKSGSGKSTIANLAALLDTPSSGEILYNQKSIKNYKEKQINHYHSNVVSIVFQHYNLLPNLTVLENIIIPRLALQENEQVARKDALNLLKELGFEEIFAKKLCKDLSGGEAQRVAILRAIINSPEIIIADEPTGALDESNSVLIMKMLKKISNKKIVIVISHNEQLALEYGDEILYLKDGRLKDVDIRRKRETSKIIDLPVSYKLGRYKKWLYSLSFKRLLKNKGKNILSGISIAVGLISIFLICGFSSGSKVVVQDKCHERFDYSVATLSKTELVDLEGTNLNLTKMSRFDSQFLNDFSLKYPYLNIDLNFDALFSNKVVKIDKKDVEGVSIKFVYDFDHEYCDSSLIYKGSLQAKNGIIINEQAEKLLKETTNAPSLIGKDIYLSTRYEIENFTNNKIVKDEFSFSHTFKIGGCSKEFEFLSVPKIFISYKYIKNILQSELINNLSKENQSEITWYDYVKNADDTSDISSYSHMVFSPLSKIKDFETLVSYYQNDETIDLDCEAMIITETFASLMGSVEIGLRIFAFLAIIGTILIIGINSFSSFAFERKNTAILFAFGVSKDQVSTVFILETIIVTLISFLISLFASIGFQYLINLLIFKKFGIENLITIPFKNFQNIPLGLVFISLIMALMLCILFTYFPLVLSKKINLKKELSDE